MLVLPGYKVIEKISNNEEIAIYRVLRIVDNVIMLAKTTNAHYVSSAVIELFHLEFKRFLALKEEGVIDPVCLEIIDERPILLFQNIEGFTLQQILLMRRDRLNLKDVLALAVAIVDCVRKLHNANIVLNELVPLYFFINENLSEAKLVDLRFSQLKGEVLNYSISTRKFESLLAYVSPKVTGCDYRSDFYSLGVILYELFANCLPYETGNALNIMYHHIATVQKPAYLQNSSMPKMVSFIIDKCMEKTPEARYASAASLKGDLEECYRQFLVNGIIQPFSLAKREVVSDWFMQQDLFSREQEKKSITDLLQIVAKGRTGAIWVNGEAGIGKTNLMESALRKELSSADLYIKIKCKQKNEHLPYSLWKQIIEKLVTQLLIENEDQLDVWKLKISEILQGDGMILLDLAPRLQLLTGEQLYHSILSGVEFEQSLHMAIIKFLQLFYEKERLFVLFIDDLHLVDKQSIEFLYYLLKAGEMRNFLVISAYRTQEMISPIVNLGDATSIIMHSITLEGFDASAVRRILHPHLNHLKKDEEESFIQLLLKKTSGNPLHMQRFLQEIADQNLVIVDDISGNWKWNVPEILALHNTQNSPAPLIQFLQTLDSPTSKLLSKAAFLGMQFNLKILAEMTNNTIGQLKELLKPAINLQLIYGVPNEIQIYTFQHEEIRQAFYSLVAEQNRNTIHMDAGLVLAKYLYEDDSISVFDVLKHLNEVKEEMVANGKQMELVKLNFKAAQQEEINSQAIVYLQIAIELLIEENWESDYSITYEIYKLRAKLAFLCEHNDYVLELCQLIITKSQTNLEKVQAYILLMQLELSRDNYNEVLRIGELALQLLKIPINFKLSKFRELRYWLNIQRKLGKFPSKEIINLPMMQDESTKAAMQVLVYIANASFISNREGWFVAVTTLLNLTMKKGMTVESSYGFAGYALIQCCITFESKSAYLYSKFASELTKDNLEMFMQVNTIVTLCHDSWRRYEPDFLLSITDYTNQHNVLSNNKWQTNYNFLINCAQLFNFSYPLKDLYVRLLSRSSMFQGDFDTLLWKSAATLSLLLTKLTGYTAAHDPFIHEKLNIKLFINDENPHLQEIAYWCEYITAYFLGHYEEAYEAIINNMVIVGSRDKRNWQNASHDYFYILIVKELFNDADDKAKKNYLQGIRKCVKKLKRMAKYCPENYLQKYLLAEAESNRIKNRFKQAEHFYEQALEVARKYGHLPDVGIIAECLAKYGLQVGKQSLAKVYINEAYTAFQNWGASAKVAILEKDYGNLLLVKRATDLERVDYLTIVSSAQALSEEIEIDRLLHKLLRIMLQNAGAEYGALIFDNEGKWVLEAFGTTDHLTVQSILLNEANHLVPTAIIDYTARTKEEVVIHDATNSVFGRNEYIQHHHLKSVLCLPIMYQNKLLSVLYMENNLSKGVFTVERLNVLKLLCTQCAISITNAKLYSGIQYLTKTLEQQVDERTESLQKSMQATSEALAEMTVYAERNRIAQEIHDIVGHTLTSTILQIEAGRRLLSKDKESATARLKDAQDLVRHSLSEIRNSVHMLKEDKYYDLEKALLTLIQDTEWNTGVVIHAEIDTVSYSPIIIKKLLYHSLQEGLTNGIRHGQSSEFHFSLKDDNSSVQFKLVDNGIGSDNLEMGFGLKMMRDRVQQLKGTFSVHAEHQKGCTINIILPYSL